MRSGRLRQLVSIQESTITQDAMGGETKDWNDKWSRRAAIEPLRGSELVEGGQVRGIATLKIIMRYWDGLKVTHRIKHGTRFYAINHIGDRNERHRQFEVLCSEFVDE